MKKEPSAVKSWKDIQANHRRAKNSNAAHERRLKTWMRFGFVSLLTLSAVLAVVVFWQVASKGSLMGDSVAEAKNPIRVLDFQTDGVLSRGWFEDTFDKAMGDSLREIDLFALEASLEQLGQIENAQVQRVLPETLYVRLKERKPVLRTRVRGEDGKPRLLLVAEDGTVYEGSGYPKKSLAHLPGVTGIRLKRDVHGYLPIERMAAASELIEKVRLELPGLYRDWTVVSLAKIQDVVPGEPAILEAQGNSIHALRLSLDNPDFQLAKLRDIIEHSNRYYQKLPKEIDLSYGRDAVIRWQ